MRLGRLNHLTLRPGYIATDEKTGKDYNVEDIDWSDKGLVIQIVGIDGRFLEHAHRDLRDDRDVLITTVDSQVSTVARSGALQFASSRLRDDDEVVLAFVKDGYSGALEFASDRLRGDRAFVKLCIELGSDLQHAAPSLREDRELILLGVASDRDPGDLLFGWSGRESRRAERYHSIPTDLKKDIPFTCELVKENISILDEISPELAQKLGFHEIDGMPEMRLDLSIKTSNLFDSSVSSDWKFEEFEPGSLRFKCQFWKETAGIAGRMGLYIPAVNEDVDAWEASRKAGEIDCYSCLGLATSLRGEMSIFFLGNTFYDRPLEIVKTIRLEPETEEMNFLGSSFSDSRDGITRSELASSIERLLDLLSEKLGAEIVPGSFYWANR